jgi:glyoxylase-like metal-dependent hydrolase (beta-lactamase superfamily II)
LGVLISGDMMLPRISTNVSVIDVEPEANPLQLFLDVHRPHAGDLPAETLVLPSHGKPFTRPARRASPSCTTTTDDRLAEVMAACAEAPQSAPTR